MHADIKVGYISVAYKELPPEISFKIREMCRIARYYPNNNSEEENWSGEDLI